MAAGVPQRTEFADELQCKHNDHRCDHALTIRMAKMPPAVSLFASIHKRDDLLKPDKLTRHSTCACTICNVECAQRQLAVPEHGCCALRTHSGQLASEGRVRIQGLINIFEPSYEEERDEEKRGNCASEVSQSENRIRPHLPPRKQLKLYCALPQATAEQN